MVNENDLEEIKALLDLAESKIRQVRSKLFSNEMTKKAVMLDADEIEGDVVQGVFDGEKMIGNDKKSYQVPANYASKSKLVPGDVLKLTVLADGRFVYKQIGPVERKHIIGTLEDAGEDEFQVDAEGKKYRVLLASVTYYKVKAGDKLSIIVPTNEESEWAAVDHVL